MNHNDANNANKMIHCVIKLGGVSDSFTHADCNFASEAEVISLVKVEFNRLFEASWQIAVTFKKNYNNKEDKIEISVRYMKLQQGDS